MPQYIFLKRAYEKPAPEDGIRILVDRLWPRGLSKDRAEIALWLKEVAPSPALRAWYGHDPEKFAEFNQKYAAELSEGVTHDSFLILRKLAQEGPITLVFAARDVAHAHAQVLKSLLLDHTTEKTM